MSDEYNIDAFKKLINKSKTFYSFRDNPLAKFLGFDKCDTYSRGVYKVGDVKPDGDNLLFDINYILSYNLDYIKEPTLHKNINNVSHDSGFGYTDDTLKLIDPDLQSTIIGQLSATINFPVKYISDVIDIQWNKKSNITRVLYNIISSNMENLPNIIYKSSADFQELVDFKAKIEKAKNKLFEFIRLAYEGTEDIVESCADKDVMTILHELYDEKI